MNAPINAQACEPFPPFEPHPLLSNGHLQTLAGYYLKGRPIRLNSQRFDLEPPDGGHLVVFEDRPAFVEKPETPAVLLVHGLAGCAESHYQRRVADRLLKLGLRVVRANLRGAGVSLKRAKGFYHAGRTSDLRFIAEWMALRFPDAPIGLIGFSLGGNLVLKLAAEAADDPLSQLDCVVAANPPIDLALCCEHMRRFPYRLYDRFFIKQLIAQVRRLHQLDPSLGPIDWAGVRTLFDFDERYTAPRNGFRNALDYYRHCSAGPRLTSIRVPGLIVHAMDDPFIPPESFFSVKTSSQIRLELAQRGGHLGYLSRQRWGFDARWLEARLCRWLSDHWGLSVPKPAGQTASLADLPLLEADPCPAPITLPTTNSGPLSKS